MSYIWGEDRGQAALLPAAIEDYVAADAPVRVTDHRARRTPAARSEGTFRNKPRPRALHGEDRRASSVPCSPASCGQRTAKPLTHKSLVTATKVRAIPGCNLDNSQWPPSVFLKRGRGSLRPRGRHRNKERCLWLSGN